jgi:hypothetical protein
MRNLDQLKSRYSHKNQNPTMAELLELMADELLQKSKQHDRKTGGGEIGKSSFTFLKQIGITSEPAITTNVSTKIRTPARPAVPEHLLEIDHIIPVALNGTNDVRKSQISMPSAQSNVC